MESCYFKNSNIFCYQENTCKNAYDINIIKNCTNIEINEVLSSQTDINYENEDEDEYVLSLECKNINIFLNIPLNTNCCIKDGILCDEEGNIKKLKL